MTAARTCPICGKPGDPGRSPFCSTRCADVDLNRWLKGAYAIPVVESDEEGESDQPEDAGGPDGTRH
ncbi:MAG: DNA gyrase inhibitor YacG [Ferrovibrio sp.]|uniref:DNA gyrase inhibitor YacG n=1 Tax=Ferrovibrio sp. TaxID=1917215 RepID=UPI00260768E6|nr:DNA gyrase inhibitor YacG [Ferrovibrio sp.]MCW0232966.1 DNA gyrase inhibitor YacG [Ferrovibrio sp.]